MNLACYRPKIDVIHSQFTKKPSTNKSCEDDHSDHFSPGTESFYFPMSLDIESIIQQSYQSHTEKSKEQNVGFCPCHEAIVDDPIFLQEKRRSDHQCHDQKKNSASHGWRPLFMFMHLRKYSGFLARNSHFTNSLSHLIFLQ